MQITWVILGGSLIIPLSGNLTSVSKLHDMGGTMKHSKWSSHVISRCLRGFTHPILTTVIYWFTSRALMLIYITPTMPALSFPFLTKLTKHIHVYQGNQMEIKNLLQGSEEVTIGQFWGLLNLHILLAICFEIIPDFILKNYKVIPCHVLFLTCQPFSTCEPKICDSRLISNLISDNSINLSKESRHKALDTFGN